MCGLVGAVGNIDNKVERAFKTLLVVDSLRGEHSTGVAAIGRYSDPLIGKVVGNPFELFETAVYDKIMRRMNKVLIGHNRFATTGGISRNNAHPFELGDVIGAHNGTLQGQHNLEDGSNFKVDSQALLNHISKHGVKNAIDKVGGAWALTWWNTATNTMNFLRNKERPLFLTETLDGKTLLWASEEWMLLVACNRAEISIHKPWILPEDIHFSLTVPHVNEVLSAMHQEEAKSSYVPFTQPQGTVFIGRVTPPKQVSGGTKIVNIDDAKKKIVEDIYKGGLSDKKGVEFEIDQLRQSSDGAHYFVCKPVIENSIVQFRLYVNKESDRDLLNGEVIVADIGKLYHNVTHGYHYKISRSSVSIKQEKKKCSRA